MPGSGFGDWCFPVQILYLSNCVLAGIRVLFIWDLFSYISPQTMCWTFWNTSSSGLFPNLVQNVVKYLFGNAIASKLCFEYTNTKQSFVNNCVPKQSLGTSRNCWFFKKLKCYKKRSPQRVQICNLTNSNDKKLNAKTCRDARPCVSTNQCLTVMHFEKRALKTRSWWIVVCSATRFVAPKNVVR